MVGNLRKIIKNIIIAVSLGEKQHYFWLTVWGQGALYMQLNTQFFIQILFVGNDSEKMHYVGSVAVVAQFCMSFACSACQHLLRTYSASGVAKVKRDNNAKEKYVNTAKEGFEASSPFTETLSEVKPLLLDLQCNNENHHCLHYLLQECLLLLHDCVIHAQRKLKVTGNTWDATAAS